MIMKSKPTNDELDAKILKVLDDKEGMRFEAVCTAVGISPCGMKNDDFRLVDRALQRLRKQAKIMFSHNGGWIRKTGEWEAVNSKSVTKRLKAQKA